MSLFFFFNDTATTEIYTLSLHDALPISIGEEQANDTKHEEHRYRRVVEHREDRECPHYEEGVENGDRKSTRLNSSHSQISYAVFCLKKKKNMMTLWLGVAQMPLTT